MKTNKKNKVKVSQKQFNECIDKYISDQNINITADYSVEGSFGGVMPDGKGPNHTFDLLDNADAFVCTVDESAFVALINSAVGAKFKTNMDIVDALPEI